MNHPYSGSASYIYANEYPYTPVAAHHNGPYGKMQSFIPINSVDSLPTLHPYSAKNTAWTDNSATETQFSDEYDRAPRSRRESQRRLLPLRLPVAHPYAQPQQLDSWLDDESVAETPVAPKFQPQRGGARTFNDPAARKPTFAPYEPRVFEERDRERTRARLAAAWRRKVQRRVKRALRRLRKFLEGL
ncbi:hypothetical protein DFH09DRAFT_1157301 [Mycena vulgaris]|nr:hypothetical protein DFH09DRAFT_1157301 [Mycena vulgaris]